MVVVGDGGLWLPTMADGNEDSGKRWRPTMTDGGDSGWWQRLAVVDCDS